jgi:hypothetical protein
LIAPSGVASGGGREHADMTIVNKTSSAERTAGN